MAEYDFRIIKPIAIVDATMTTSNVPETTSTAYNAGTTYGAGDLVGGAAAVDGAPQSIYESLQAGNLAHTPASSPTWWLYLGTVYKDYSGAFSYALADVVSDRTSGVHKLYESLSAANVGNALTDTAKWLDLGPTNRWEMFDEVFQSRTSRGAEIVVTLTLGELINSVAMLNVVGTEVTVEQSISGYSRTESLNQHPVLTWYDWFYELLIQKNDVVFTDIPPYAASTLTVTVTTADDAIAEIGVLIAGRYQTIGWSQWGLSRSINDYSSATEDVYGNVTLTQRGYSKRMVVDVYVRAGLESNAVKQLTDIRATPIVFIASDDYDAAIVYGFLGQWNVPLNNNGEPARIEIKGLV